MLSEIFWTFVVTTAAGLIFGMSKLCFKSKCTEVDFLCIKVIRDTSEESDGSDGDIETSSSFPTVPSALKPSKNQK